MQAAILGSRPGKIIVGIYSMQPALCRYKSDDVIVVLNVACYCLASHYATVNEKWLNSMSMCSAVSRWQLL